MNRELGGRYGIWGIDPYGPEIKRTPLISAMFNSAKEVGNLRKQGYENQELEAKGRLAQGTVDSEIAAKNAMNQANQQNYPLQQMFKTQQEQQTVKEIMARTGLSYAQAKHALAGANAENARAGLYGAETQNTANPFSQTSNMIKMFESLPDGSPQKMMLGSILDREFASGMFPGGAKGKAVSNNTNTGQAPLAGLGSSWLKDPRMGPSRGGQGGTYIDPQTGQVISTDTSAQTTRDQRSIAGIQNLDQYLNEAIKTLPQFQTAKAKGALGLKSLSNFALGTNYAAPSQMAEGKAAILESAEGFINGFQLNATNENVDKAAKIMTPRFGESGAGYKTRVKSQLENFAAQERRAQERLKSGNVIGQEAPQASSAPGYFSQLAMGINPEAPQQQQQQPQFAPAQLNSWAQEAIAKGADPAAVQARLQQMQRGG